MVPGDRLLCVLVENKPIGFEFKDWLLHVTIVPWFRLEIESKALRRDLETVLKAIRPFSVFMGQENVGFGHQKGKMATLIKLPTPLIEIEHKVRAYFHSQHAWLVDETTKRTSSFKPHITNQKNGSMHEGDIFTCDKLFVVEQKGGYKKITGEVNLG
ncbi:MAG TPA: hypothetical protein VLG47_07000 [Candidatus Saccharimonadales bacterium]|nr:hypothetical protein [Candidatus Saccharimonadales bacterium]